eukprot:TRINITY_DN7902_c0_g1_i1.p1 TRINITY_DN7902_c0_g1~~TRINITY_DN7902_c0_g1_i1.p1  ORF type:complete len:1481 (+),score=318.79 TRINITY_DN7902_c0_g1_i1:352-4794(+)
MSLLWRPGSLVASPVAAPPPPVASVRPVPTANGSSRGGTPVVPYAQVVGTARSRTSTPPARAAVVQSYGGPPRCVPAVGTSPVVATPVATCSLGPPAVVLPPPAAITTSSMLRVGSAPSSLRGNSRPSSLAPPAVVVGSRGGSPSARSSFSSTRGGSVLLPANGGGAATPSFRPVRHPHSPQSARPSFCGAPSQAAAVAVAAEAQVSSKALDGGSPGRSGSRPATMLVRSSDVSQSASSCGGGCIFAAGSSPSRPSSPPSRTPAARPVSESPYVSRALPAGAPAELSTARRGSASLSPEPARKRASPLLSPEALVGSPSVSFQPPKTAATSPSAGSATTLGSYVFQTQQSSSAATRETRSVSPRLLGPAAASGPGGGGGATTTVIAERCAVSPRRDMLPAAAGTAASGATSARQAISNNTESRSRSASPSPALVTYPVPGRGRAVVSTSNNAAATAAVTTTSPSPRKLVSPRSEELLAALDRQAVALPVRRDLNISRRPPAATIHGAPVSVTPQSAQHIHQCESGALVAFMELSGQQNNCAGGSQPSRPAKQLPPAPTCRSTEEILADCARNRRNYSVALDEVNSRVVELEKELLDFHRRWLSLDKKISQCHTAARSHGGRLRDHLMHRTMELEKQIEDSAEKFHETQEQLVEQRRLREELLKLLRNATQASNLALRNARQSRMPEAAATTADARRSAVEEQCRSPVAVVTTSAAAAQAQAAGKMEPVPAALRQQAAVLLQKHQQYTKQLQLQRTAADGRESPAAVAVAAAADVARSPASNGASSASNRKARTCAASESVDASPSTTAASTTPSSAAGTAGVAPARFKPLAGGGPQQLRRGLPSATAARAAAHSAAVLSPSSAASAPDSGLGFRQRRESNAGTTAGKSSKAARMTSATAAATAAVVAAAAGATSPSSASTRSSAFAYLKIPRSLTTLMSPSAEGTEGSCGGSTPCHGVEPSEATLETEDSGMPTIDCSAPPPLFQEEAPANTVVVCAATGGGSGEEEPHEGEWSGDHPFDDDEGEEEYGGEMPSEVPLAAEGETGCCAQGGVVVDDMQFHDDHNGDDDNDDLEELDPEDIVLHSINTTSDTSTLTRAPGIGRRPSVISNATEDLTREPSEETFLLAFNLQERGGGDCMPPPCVGGSLQATAGASSLGGSDDGPATTNAETDVCSNATCDLYKSEGCASSDVTDIGRGAFCTEAQGFGHCQQLVSDAGDSASSSTAGPWARTQEAFTAPDSGESQLRDVEVLDSEEDHDHAPEDFEEQADVYKTTSVASSAAPCEDAAAREADIAGGRSPLRREWFPAAAHADAGEQEEILEMHVAAEEEAFGAPLLLHRRDGVEAETEDLAAELFEAQLEECQDAADGGGDNDGEHAAGEDVEEEEREEETLSDEVEEVGGGSWQSEDCDVETVGRPPFAEDEEGVRHVSAARSESPRKRRYSAERCQSSWRLVGEDRWARSQSEGYEPGELAPPATSSI